jgi:hypothetical protein
MLENLIQQGQTFNFRNNSQTNSHGTYGKASDELLGWAANVEDFIRENYGESSGPYKLFLSYDQTRLTGYYESDFNKQMTILMGALKACRQIEPRKKEIKDDHPITSLLKNLYFWTVVTSVTAVSFMLGLYFGTSKFDKDKSDYYEENRAMKMNLDKASTEIQKKDSLINVYKLEIDNYKKSNK